ncbi:MAG: hypothetical protein R3228_10940 [Halioglobus sp.]|nr:hypothetical protein [Halioglobus sp.]
MTQHEYVFVAISIILGLAITRLLHNVATLIRAFSRVNFHPATAVWGLCVMIYCLQLWWVGWGLRSIETWSFADFAVLIAGSIFLYGAAEMALPVPGESRELNFLNHSQGLGRLSSLSMLLYFLVGPYVNIKLFAVEVLPALVIPAIGAIILLLMITVPRAYRWLSLVFTLYTGLVLTVTI